MSVIELKQQLYKEIEKISDENILDNLFQITKNVAESTINNETVFVSDQERKAIESGLKDAREGRTISYDEFLKKYSKWLSK